MNTRSKTIDILRFLTVFYVAGFTHLLSYAGIRISSFHPACGYSIKIMMASLVFVSGYLNGKKAYSDKQGVKKFYKKRLISTYFPFAISSILSYGVFLIAGKWLFNDMRSFVLSLLGISSIFTPPPGTLWFILMMLILYLITPFLLFKRNNTSLLLKAIIIFAMLLILHYALDLVDDRLLMYYPTYILGLFLSNTRPDRTKNIVLLSLSIAVTSISAFYVAGLTENIHILSVVLPFSLPVMFALCELISKIAFLSNILAYLGSISMCVYLFHRHVYDLLGYILGTPFTVPFCYLIALPVCIAVSVAMYYLIKLVTDRKTN